MTDRPDIVEVIGARVQLRQAGRELSGLCPFHVDKTPSLSVSPEKGLFHCFGCGASGDVIDFLRKLKGLSYPEALAELGMDSSQPARPARSKLLLIEARKVAAWADEMTWKAEYLLRDLFQQTPLALPGSATAQSLTREWQIIEQLAEDLQREEHIVELFRQRDAIENILGAAQINKNIDLPDEEVPAWPEWTPEYQSFLRDHLPDVQHNG